MKSRMYVALVFGLLVVISAVAAAASGVEEIPVTTSNEQALADFMKGQRLLDVGRPQEANKLFEAAVEKDPAFSYAYLNIANSAASAQEFKDNLDLAMEHIEGKSEGERLLCEINRTFLDNDAEKRIKLAKTLVEKYPRSPRAWLTQASMQTTLNDIEAARKSMKRALELDPQMIAANVALGFSYLFSDPKNFTLSEQFLARCVELNPGEAKAYENLGDVHRAMKDLQRAREYYSQAHEKDPTLSAASIKMGHINSFLGNFDEARADYDAGIAGAKEQNKANYANYRAFTHLHAGNVQAALTELGQIVNSIDGIDIPNDQKQSAKIFTLTNQATIALHHNLLDDAERILMRRAAVIRASAERVGDQDFARQQEANILLFEGQLAARKGDYQTARAKAEKNRALLEADSNPRKFEGYLGLLGLVELLQGNSEKAVEHYRKANLTVMYVKYHLALALEGAGQTYEAKQLFKEVAEWNFNSVGFALVRKDALAKIA